MRLGALLVALLLAAPLAAEEITVDKVIAAKSFGAPDETVLAKIKDLANTVGPVSAADQARLRAASVSEPVIAALLARAPAPAPAAETGPTQPDNPTMSILVKLVQAGTSETLIADQIKQQGVHQRPTMKDIIYLKENKVADAVIRALMEAPLITSIPGATTTGTTTKVAPPPQQVDIEGLVLKKGMLSKNRVGKLTLKADKIEWNDGTSQADSFEMFPAGLKAVNAECNARPEGKFCHEVALKMMKGSDFAFVDAKQEVGGNDAINALLKAVRVLYPKLPVVEKVK